MGGGREAVGALKDKTNVRTDKKRKGGVAAGRAEDCDVENCSVYDECSELLFFREDDASLDGDVLECRCSDGCDIESDFAV